MLFLAKRLGQVDDFTAARIQVGRVVNVVNVVIVGKRLSQPTGNEHHRELEPLADVHGHDLHLFLFGLDLMDVGIILRTYGLFPVTVQQGGKAPEVQIFPVGNGFQVFEYLAVVGVFSVPVP